MFAALAHHSRRQIVSYLAARPTAPRMKAVAEDHGMSPQLLNKHTAVLEKAGLVSRVARGRDAHLVLRADALAAAQQWIEQTRAFWEHQFDSLERYIAELEGRGGSDTDREGDSA